MKNILSFYSFINEQEERNDFYKKELNNSFWKGESFDPEIREKLISIANDFYKDLKLDIPIEDIQLTGSLANYNWTDKSDLDVHILIDFSKIDDNVDLVKKALDGVRFIWNLRHKVFLRGHDVEVYIQDINAPHTASGLFSLMNNKWIRIPKYSPPEIDYNDVDKKFDGIVSEIVHMENLVNTSDFSSVSKEEIYEYTKKLKAKILKSREEGLRKDGEFSVENLVFKKLRNEGYIQKIIELISKAYVNIYNE